MSKLSDRIRKALRVESAPIGFRAAARVRNPPLLVIVRLASADAKTAAAAVEKGADSVLFRDPKAESKDVKAAAEACGEAVCGLWVDGIDQEGVARVVENGVDYLVIDGTKTAAAAMLEEKPGFVLALEGELSDTFLRSVDLLGLDAVVLPQGKEPLTVQAQMELRRIVLLTRKPLMLPVPASLNATGLRCLRDSGVSLLLIDGEEKGALEALPALREAIEKLPPPKRRREERAGAVLPKPSDMVVGEEEEEEEEDEE